MAIERIDIADQDFEKFVFDGLVEHGFDPRIEGDVIHLSGVGVGEGNSSVDAQLNLVHMDGHRILEIVAPIRMTPVSFDMANLMAAQGNLSCHIAKFRPVEIEGSGTHFVQASFALFADHLSVKELGSMMYLFIKEVDAIDDEIVALAGQSIKSGN